MRTRLPRLCVAAVLALGGWGSAIAAALCAHAGAGHGCCAERSGEGRSSHAHSSGADHEQAEAHGESCDGESPSSGNSHATPAGEARRAVPAAQRSRFCAHCVGRPENAPPKQVPAPEHSRRGHEGHAATAPNPAITNTPPFLAPINPKQGAPPGGPAHRHLLLSVFRI